MGWNSCISSAFCAPQLPIYHAIYRGPSCSSPVNGWIIRDGCSLFRFSISSLAFWNSSICRSSLFLLWLLEGSTPLSTASWILSHLDQVLTDIGALIVDCYAQQSQKWPSLAGHISTFLLLSTCAKFLYFPHQILQCFVVSIRVGANMLQNFLFAFFPSPCLGAKKIVKSPTTSKYLQCIHRDIKQRFLPQIPEVLQNPLKNLRLIFNRVNLHLKMMLPNLVHLRYSRGWFFRCCWNVELQGCIYKIPIGFQTPSTWGGVYLDPKNIPIKHQTSGNSWKTRETNCNLTSWSFVFPPPSPEKADRHGIETSFWK